MLHVESDPVHPEHGLRAADRKSGTLFPELHHADDHDDDQFHVVYNPFDIQHNNKQFHNDDYHDGFNIYHHGQHHDRFNPEHQHNDREHHDHDNALDHNVEYHDFEHDDSQYVHDHGNNVHDDHDPFNQHNDAFHVHHLNDDDLTGLSVRLQRSAGDTDRDDSGRDDS